MIHSNSKAHSGENLNFHLLDTHEQKLKTFGPEPQLCVNSNKNAKQ
jgi:hypothetical protein